MADTHTHTQASIELKTKGGKSVFLKKRWLIPQTETVLQLTVIASATSPEEDPQESSGCVWLFLFFFGEF